MLVIIEGRAQSSMLCSLTYAIFALLTASVCSAGQKVTPKMIQDQIQYWLFTFTNGLLVVGLYIGTGVHQASEASSIHAILSYRIDSNGCLFLCYRIESCDSNDTTPAPSLPTHLLGTLQARLVPDPFIQCQDWSGSGHHHWATIQSERDRRLRSDALGRGWGTLAHRVTHSSWLTSTVTRGRSL